MYFLYFLVLQNAGIISKLHSIARGAEQRCNFLFQFFIPTQSIYSSLGRGRGMLVALGGLSAGYIMLHQDNIVFISFYVDNANTLPRVKFIIETKKKARYQISLFLF